MSISLSPAAVTRVRSFLTTRPEAVGLRFGVRRTGCSGWAYVVDLTDSLGADDQVFEQEGLRIVVDAGSLPLVDGTRIDFRQKGLGSEFIFENPNVAGECGCGESFSVEKSAA